MVHTARQSGLVRAGGVWTPLHGTVQSTDIARIWEPMGSTQNQPCEVTPPSFSFAGTAWKSVGVRNVWHCCEKERNIFSNRAKPRD